MVSRRLAASLALSANSRGTNRESTTQRAIRVAPSARTRLRAYKGVTIRVPCLATTPPLTTVDLHPAEHGAVAVQQLVNASASEPVAFSQLRPATLIIRESCGASLGARSFD